jgi:hypothetical protein
MAARQFEKAVPFERVVYGSHDRTIEDCWKIQLAVRWSHDGNDHFACRCAKEVFHVRHTYAMACPVPSHIRPL